MRANSHNRKAAFKALSVKFHELQTEVFKALRERFLRAAGVQS